mgnify:CR=1 FL=1
MFARNLVLALILLILSAFDLYAQTGSNRDPLLPLRANRSPLFGKDIIVDNQPSQDQKDVLLCQAFNGWLFCAYSCLIPDSNFHVYILKSIDNGISWSYFSDFSTGWANEKLERLSIATTGTNESNLKFFIGRLLRDTITGYTRVSFWRLNGVTGICEAQIFDDLSWEIRDICMTSDCNYPASGSNPNSLGILYSRPNLYEEIILRVSMDGGMTFQNRKVAEDKFQMIVSLSLAFGSSNSANVGKYFAAWETRDFGGGSTGHVYTAHSQGGPNTVFTPPACLDCSDPNLNNNCKNPRIACQYGPMDNDSSNLTSVVLFETNNVGSTSNDVHGFYNIQSTQTSYYKPLSITNPSHLNTSPDIVYNPFDSTFIVTYYDSTAKKLPYLSNDMNLSSPQTWNLVTDGYNDVAVYRHPTPRIIANNVQPMGASVWIADGSGNNGVATFDAGFSTYTGGNEKTDSKEKGSLKVFPNPCSSILTVEFNLDNNENFQITLCDMPGQKLQTHTNRTKHSGLQQIQYDLTSYPSGCYLLYVNTERFSSCTKLIID